MKNLRNIVLLIFTFLTFGIGNCQNENGKAKDVEEIKISENEIDEPINEYLTQKLIPIRENFKRVNSIENWTEIDDVYADKLITEFKNNLTNDALMNRNATALEKKYKKSSGTLSHWIFNDDITENKKILELLKKDTTIQL